MRFNLRRKKESQRPQDSLVQVDENFTPQQTIPQQFGDVDILSGRIDMLDSSVTAIRGWVEDARNRITALEGNVNENIPTIRTDIEGIKKNLESVGEKLQQLMSLYEVISTQYNPFIETSVTPSVPREAASSEEKEIEDLLRSVAPEQFPVTTGDSVVEIPERYNTIEEPEMAELAPIPEEEFGLESTGYELEERSAEAAVLSRIPDSYTSNAFAMNLLEFLISRVGRKNLPDLLEYYESIGWISGDVREQLFEMASGVSVKEGFAPDWRLNAGDNLRALQFIEQIRGRPVKKSELEEIDRKVEKIKSS
jgi:archaellum component FlaD/FlaE